MAYFPMFIDIEDQECLIVGGGNVALRKVEVLREFNARVTVIAPLILKKIRETKGILCVEREFDEKDLDSRFLVVAATENEGLNHEISRLCAGKKILVNAVDQIEDCSFIFPSYLKAGEAVAAFSSSGKSPVLTQYLKSQTKRAVEEKLGDFEKLCSITDYMGMLRPGIKAAFQTEGERKKVYKMFLSSCLERGGPLSEQETKEKIEYYQRENSAVRKIEDARAIINQGGNR